MTDQSNTTISESTSCTCYAFQENSGAIDIDSVSDSPDGVRHKMLEGVMGWRYRHPDRYSHDEAWAAILKTGSVVKVVVSPLDSNCSETGQNAPELLKYRVAREQMLEATIREFPPGTRVQPIGTTTGKWGATVSEIDEHHRRELSADMVFLDWDNGNKFAVNIDEIERL